MSAWQLNLRLNQMRRLATTLNGRFHNNRPTVQGTEYAFARRESCRSRHLKAERQVSGRLLPD